MTFEDLGYYCVDNLPVGLIANFAELVLDTLEIQRAALVVDIREGARLDKLPQILGYSAENAEDYGAVSGGRRGSATAPLQRDASAASAGTQCIGAGLAGVGTPAAAAGEGAGRPGRRHHEV